MKSLRWAWLCCYACWAHCRLCGGCHSHSLPVSSPDVSSTPAHMDWNIVNMQSGNGASDSFCIIITLHILIMSPNHYAGQDHHKNTLKWTNSVHLSKLCHTTEYSDHVVKYITLRLMLSCFQWKVVVGATPSLQSSRTWSAVTESNELILCSLSLRMTSPAPPVSYFCTSSAFQEFFCDEML